MGAAPIGIGVVSFAHGHVGMYCDRIASFPDARLVAGWDENDDRRAAQCARFGIPAESRLEDLLGRREVEAVIIASETNRHAEHCEAAAAAGKAILLQKPMATSLADCDRILRAVERSGVHLEIAFQMRCDPVNRKMAELVREGAIGRIGTVRRRHCINFLFNPPGGPSRWHLDPAANVGMFFDDAVHAADFLFWLLGPPVSVMAEIDNVLTRVAPDDTGAAIYRFPGGAFGLLYNSSVTLAGENTTEIYGDQGVLLHNYGDAVSTAHAPPGAIPLRRFRPGSPGSWEEFAIPVPRQHGERIAAVPRPWIDRLRAGAPPEVSGADGRISVAMCLAAYRSARDGRRVNLAEMDEESP